MSQVLYVSLRKNVYCKKRGWTDVRYNHFKRGDSVQWIFTLNSLLFKNIVSEIELFFYLQQIL